MARPSLNGKDCLFIARLGQSLLVRFAGEAVRNYGDVIPSATKNMRNVVR